MRMKWFIRPAAIALLLTFGCMAPRTERTTGSLAKSSPIGVAPGSHSATVPVPDGAAELFVGYFARESGDTTFGDYFCCGFPISATEVMTVGHMLRRASADLGNVRFVYRGARHSVGDVVRPAEHAAGAGAPEDWCVVRISPSIGTFAPIRPWAKEHFLLWPRQVAVYGWHLRPASRDGKVAAHAPAPISSRGRTVALVSGQGGFTPLSATCMDGMSGAPVVEAGAIVGFVSGYGSFGACGIQFSSDAFVRVEFAIRRYHEARGTPRAVRQPSSENTHGAGVMRR